MYGSVVAERGQSCRKVDRRGRLAAEPFDVELARDKVLVRFRGRLVRTLTGADADAVRAVFDNPEQLQLVVARLKRRGPDSLRPAGKAGNFKRGNER